MIPGHSALRTLRGYDVTYNFTFISLISPYLVDNLRLLHISSSPSTPGKSTILLKQSYLIYTWFCYLKTSVMDKSNKFKSIKFAHLPVKRTSYTLTKAPMAHKTNSQEQFVFKFHKYKISIKTRLTVDYAIKSIDEQLLALLLAKSIFPVFSTNLLLLKYYILGISGRDSHFFSYYRFKADKNPRAGYVASIEDVKPAYNAPLFQDQD